MNIIQFSLRSKHARQLVVACLTTILLVISWPAYSAERKTYTTFGKRTCNEWITDTQQSRAGIADVANKAWFFGYLSSLNTGQGLQVDVLGAIDGDTAILWVDRFCANNPDKDLSDAAYGLFIELLKIEVKKAQNKRKRNSGPEK